MPFQRKDEPAGDIDDASCCTLQLLKSLCGGIVLAESLDSLG